MKKKLLIIFVILGVVILRNNYSLRNDIAVYIDNEETKEVPKKNTGYVFDKVKCDSDVDVSWNSDTWSLSLNKLNTKTRCSLYFEEDKVVKRIINSLDTTSKCLTVNSDGSVNVTAAEAENSLVCSAQDNYGTSYYFRGNVSNNYVKFANLYWRILRINSDGTIRLIYDGTVAHKNGEFSEDRQIGTSPYNTLHNDNAYVGYMYGTPSSSSYEETHQNINDSDVKKYIDTWYENNLLNVKYEQYLADNLFCNDRRIGDYNPSNQANLGYGQSITIYSNAYGPWSAEAGTINSKLGFKCYQKNDGLTVKDFVNGTASLKYPIALAMKSEIVMAGGFNFYNTTNYIYTGTDFWTMSPDSFYISNNEYTVTIRIQSKRGSGAGVVAGNGSYGVKPVINLKANSLKNGLGTKEYPYTVE